MADEGEGLLEAGEDGVLALEGVLAEEEVEDGVDVVLAGLPVGIAHGDLVEVGEERPNERVGVGRCGFGFGFGCGGVGRGGGLLHLRTFKSICTVQ